ncbi:MAG: hypothetical protein RMK52_09420 [Chitinophagales bacterium]|nr:hypothetical protein [Chitinophagales bacterium]MDW8394444.1 hypothetical protein [Chitinophagales bacterium]
MIRNVLSSIEGVAFWPVVALLLLMGFFMVVVWRVWRLPSSQVKKMKEIPLHNDEKGESPKDF